MIEKKVLYFDTPGRDNTLACVEQVRREVEENGYRYVVVASNSGETGLEFAKALKDMDSEVYVVKYSEGMEDNPEIDEDIKGKLTEQGATLFRSPSIDMSLDSAFGLKLAPMEPSRVVHTALKSFGEGLKVCCEIVMMATDKGLISQGVEAIAVAGTDSGADTVAVVKASASNRFRELKVLEILAKPRI